jgi:hypothetical protein
MILNDGHSTNYLLDYKDGKISMGLGIGCVLDDYIRFKRKQLNIVLGHDNVGKSYFMLWYFLCLAVKHNLKFVLWMGENSSGQVMRDLIQMYSGNKFSDLSKDEILTYNKTIEQWFKFVSNEQMYTPQEILKIIETQDCDVAFIDPFTGLNRGMQHSDNYEFLNTTRDFCNRTNKTLYISTHPTSESGRTSMLYPQDHVWNGHLKPPLKAHIEGGKPFLNRCDDMLVIHRLVKHESMKYFTMIDIEKIKDRDTGGQQTELNQPLLFDYNFGKGFTIGGVNPLQQKHEIKRNTNFDLPF